MQNLHTVMFWRSWVHQNRRLRDGNQRMMGDAIVVLVLVIRDFDDGGSSSDGLDTGVDAGANELDGVLETCIRPWSKAEVDNGVHEREHLLYS